MDRVKGQEPLAFPNPWLTQDEESNRRWFGDDYENAMERARQMPSKPCPSCGEAAYFRPAIGVYVCPMCHGKGEPDGGWYSGMRSRRVSVRRDPEMPCGKPLVRHRQSRYRAGSNRD